MSAPPGKTVVGGLLVCCATWPRCNLIPVFAYLDAGTLSLAAAVLAGGFASVLVLLRMYGNKFLGLFSKKRRLKAEIAEGELLGIEIDPETGQPVDPEAADALLGKTKDESSTIGDSA